MNKRLITRLISIAIVTIFLAGCNTNESNVDDKTNSSEESNKTKNNDLDSSKKDDVTKNSKEAISNKETNNNDTQKVSSKEQYLAKLDSIQEGLHDLDSLYAGTTLEMKKAASEEYQRWDKALNEIYNYLKQTLDKEAFSKLEKEEVEWIKNKEETAKNNSKKYEGGSLESLEYTSSLVRSTKDRCYELVNNYMK